MEQHPDPVEQAILRGDRHIDVAELNKGRNLSHIILGQPFRDYFSKQVKDPMRIAIESLGKGKSRMENVKAIITIIRSAKKYPEPTKENTTGIWTHPLMDIIEEFHSYNKDREDLFKGGSRVVVGEVEHDSFYRDRFLALIDFIIIKILDGKWPGRAANRPNPQHWTEPQPYGGEESIVYKLALYREEIKEMIRHPKEDE